MATFSFLRKLIEKSNLQNDKVAIYHPQAKYQKDECTLLSSTFKVQESKVSSDLRVLTFFFSEIWPFSEICSEISILNPKIWPFLKKVGNKSKKFKVIYFLKLLKLEKQSAFRFFIFGVFSQKFRKKRNASIFDQNGQKFNFFVF